VENKQLEHTTSASAINNQRNAGILSSIDFTHNHCWRHCAERNDLELEMDGITSFLS
jgi:hypothetical protein